MKKLIGFLAVMALLTLPLFHRTNSMNYHKAAVRAMDASVLIHMKGWEMSERDHKFKRIYAECSGTYVSPTHILSAAHCFEGYIPTYVWARGPNDLLGYPVHVINVTGAKDLAVLEAPFSHPYVKIGKPAKIGEEVMNIGSPLDFEFVASNGIVALSYYKIKEFTSTYIVTTAMANPGSSGGGCFNRKGELIGVNTMIVGFMGWSGLTISVGVESIQEVLGSLR